MQPSDAVALRPAEAADADAVAALLAVLGYPCSREDARQRIEAVAEELHQELLMAELDGEVCGLLALDLMYYLPLGVRTARITALAVGRAQGGRGVGRAMLREAEVRARAAGAARIEVTSAAHRDDAHAFYQACGYSESARRYLKHLGAA
jgi:ribosomal protein S18 acetylase RimI-like enzyme